ncbi:MAG: glycosyltransferase family 2 protein [Solirubrobacteraceae bacterium]
MIRTPELSVVVASRDRPLRLRWLLGALAEQTIGPERFEVIVCHDSRGPETAALLAGHPLSLLGSLHEQAFPAGTLLAGAKRNAGWRIARAPIIAFTDDDCRPPADWLEQIAASVRRHPGAIVQGSTRPDPEELELALRVPHARTQNITPPSVWAETCNIAYPRSVLERLGGFDESVESGEDTDLALRAGDAGVVLVGAPGALTYHAVHVDGLRALLRSTSRWEPVPWLIARHPTLRGECFCGVFWRESHGWMVLALVGGLFPRRAAGLLMMLPWTWRARHDYGPGVRGRLRSLGELPSQALIDLTEIRVLARGSRRYRTLVL